MTLETQHFHLSFCAEDRVFAEKIVELIEGVYSQIIATFEISDSGEMYRFVLCEDIPEYLQETGKRADEYESWMIGWADYSRKKLCILSPRAVLNRTELDMEQIIAHEIVHIAFDSLGNPDEMNICLAEGIAVLCANQIKKDEINIENPPSFWDIYDENGFYEYAGYQYSGVYVRYLLRYYGSEVFKELYIGKRDIRPYITENFEKDALLDFLEQVQ